MKESAIWFLIFAILTAGNFSCKKTPRETTLDTPIVRPKKEITIPHEEIIVSSDWQDIKKRGMLRAIMKNNATGYFIYKGSPLGFEYELISRFCKENQLGLEILIEGDLEKCFEMLNSGEVDLIAHNLTVTKERKKNVEFTRSHYQVRQMLIQRLPDEWWKMKQHEIDKYLLKDPIDLIGKEVYVRKNSSYVQRLRNLSEEIGEDIIIIEEFGDVQTEELIKRVASGEINYTVADEDIARINATYYRNINAETPLSFPTQIAWAVRKNAPEFLGILDEWISGIKQTPDYNVIYSRYFNDPKGFISRVTSDYSSMGGNKISPYDAYIKKYAKRINWDWRLLAALMYRESQFNPKAKSWAGAEGLMQLMPQTAEKFGVKNIHNPDQNIRGGIRLIEYLDKFWKIKVPDENERMKFILASYNAGNGHVEDATRLAVKYGKDPQKWDDNVEFYLLKKSEPAYYEDPVTSLGYCRGDEPVEYVKYILNQYAIYRQLIQE